MWSPAEGAEGAAGARGQTAFASLISKEVAVGIAEEGADLPFRLDRCPQELGASVGERLVRGTAVWDPRISSARLVEALADQGGFRIGDQLELARVLRPAGVYPRTMRFGNMVLKAYSVSELRKGVETIWRRYTGHSSGTDWSKPYAEDSLVERLMEESPLYRAWIVANPENAVEEDALDRWPTTADEYRQHRFRWKDDDDETRRETSAEVAALSKPRA